jgi:hypothetical protein
VGVVMRPSTQILAAPIEHPTGNAFCAAGAGLLFYAQIMNFDFQALPKGCLLLDILGG